MLNELEQKEKELLAQLHAVRESIKKERLMIAEQEHGVKAGSIVKDRKGVEYKVTLVNTRFSGKPWLTGTPKKKDGTFGVAVRNIYGEWELVSA